MSADSDMEYSDNDCEYDDYYNSGEDCDVERLDPKKTDPEYFDYNCLTVEEVEKLINESVEKLNTVLQITPSLAKVLLLEHQWNNQVVVDKYHEDATALMVTARIKPPVVVVEMATSSESPSTSAAAAAVAAAKESGCGNVLLSMGGYKGANAITAYRSQMCPVCAASQLGDKFDSLACGHSFCRDCWTIYFETQIFQGISTQIGCMAPMCNVRVPEDLVLTLLTRPIMRDKYQQFAFKDYVKSHPELRFCPGPNCQIIIQARETCAKRAICKSCTTSFCFKCGMEYHAPTDCRVIKKWLTKCADDSETANYISANTKDCPKCHICIEKNGGCNHMQCFNCKHDFCWMCLGDWKTHGSEYYECSRYKDNPNIANESVHVQAREALKKYLHYYERWENHSKSLQLEQQTLDRLRQRVNEKVMKGRGTWIDWQYLFNAAGLLAKCRYTLQYTYPYAYFMDVGSRKDLFEYQQAQLEAEIENLSWKVERAETTDLGDLENQMDIAEKRRTTLLKDFFPVIVFLQNCAQMSSNENETAGPIFSCKRCKKVFLCKRDQMLHKKEMHYQVKSSYECKICAKFFCNSGNLERHMKVHNDERPYVCRICKKAFAQAVNLQRHYSVHNGDRPYQCGFCTKSFTQLSNMQRHQLVHTGEKPFRCKRCGRYFSQRVNLKKHIMAHLNTKPYSCKICQKAFIQMANFKRHLQTHIKEGLEVDVKAAVEAAAEGAKGTMELAAQPVAFECAICRSIFDNFSSFEMHESECNGNSSAQYMEMQGHRDSVEEFSPMKYSVQRLNAHEAMQEVVIDTNR